MSPTTEKIYIKYIIGVSKAKWNSINLFTCLHFDIKENLLG